MLICCCNHITGRAAGPAPFSDKFLNVFSTVCSAGEERPCGHRFGGAGIPRRREMFPRRVHGRRGHVLPEIFCDAAVSQMFCGAAGDFAGRGELFRPGRKRWNFFQRSSLGEGFPAAMKRTGPAHFSDGAGRENLRQNFLNTGAKSFAGYVCAAGRFPKNFTEPRGKGRRISLRRRPPVSADVLK